MENKDKRTEQELIYQAVDVIQKEHKISANLISKRLDIGFAHAQRLIDLIVEAQEDRKKAAAARSEALLSICFFVMFITGILIFIDLFSGFVSTDAAYNSSKKGVLVLLALSIIPSIRAFIYPLFFISGAVLVFAYIKNKISK